MFAFARGCRLEAREVRRWALHGRVEVEGVEGVKIEQGVAG